MVHTIVRTILLLALVLYSEVQAQKTVAPSTIKVMSFNIRYASNFGANSWPKRRSGVVQVIRDTKADLIGTQEGLHHQLLYMDKELKNHKWIGVGREGGNKGEFMAIFYRTDRFKPLETRHFWLSNTPEVVGSASWGNSVKRMVTWVRFRDLKTNKEFYFWNTHFDHRSQPSREKSAQLILNRVKALKTKLPVILVGDFNAVAKANRAYDTLTGQGAFEDSFETADKKVNLGWNTFNSFRKTEKGKRRIDWVLTKGPLTINRTEIVLFDESKQIPSDHQPVTAIIHLK
jgi:endonuclease/exonuclease/phosphatase family metal-dependent hydrolase